MHRRPPILFAAAVLSLASAARAEPTALLERPVVLDPGVTQVSLRGDLSNLTGDATGSGDSLTGFSGGVGIDYGVSKGVEVGFALDFPLAPNPNFGSILASTSFLVHPSAAIRLDVGYDRDGLTASAGGNSDSSYTSRVFFGFGAPQRWVLSPMFSLVSGRSGAIDFGRFTNVGSGGVSEYLGAGSFFNDGSDILTASIGTDSGSSTLLDFRLPIGLMFQPDPHFALTVRSGFNLLFATGTNNSPSTNVEAIPLAIDLTITPSKNFDLGATFSIDGIVAENTGSDSWADSRAATFWIRFRT